MDTSPEMPVDILIGSDLYWNFMTGETRTGMNGGPVTIKTHLGWVLSGPVNEAKETPTDSSVFLNNIHMLRLDTEPIEENDCSLKEGLSKFWSIEALGIAPESIEYRCSLPAVLENGSHEECTIRGVTSVEGNASGLTQTIGKHQMCCKSTTR